jgi:hypothetical protein
MVKPPLIGLYHDFTALHFVCRTCHNAKNYACTSLKNAGADSIFHCEMNCQFRPQKSKWCKSGVNRRMQNRKVVAALRETVFCFNTAVADKENFRHKKPSLSW